MKSRSKIKTWVFGFFALPLVLFVSTISLLGVFVGVGGKSPAVCPPDISATNPNNSPASSGIDIKGRPINAEQKRNVAIIISVGKKRGFTRRDIKVTLMVAIQESSILNLNYGDRDSLGMFQQRSTWGTANQRLNPVYSTNKFYDAMATIHSREQISLLDLALQIQRPSRLAYLSSGNYFPGWEPTAEKLLGNTAFQPAPQTTPQVKGKCNYGQVDGSLHDPGPGLQDPKTGLVPRSANLQGFILANWGCEKTHTEPCIREIGGYSVRPPGTPQDHTLGLALDITISNGIGTPPVLSQTALGWNIACFIADNANNLGVRYLIWQGKIWNVTRSKEGGSGGCGNGKGWRPYTYGYGVIKGHYDHVHITVQPGVGG